MDEPEIDIRSLLELLRRRAKLILTTITISLVGALVVTLALTPTYTSSALLLINTRTIELLDPATPIGNALSDNARVDSEVEILRSDDILLDVIARSGLMSHTEFGLNLTWHDHLLSLFRIRVAELPTGTDARNAVLDRLRNAVSVSRRGHTYLISVSITTQSPATAAEIANTMATAYIEAQVRAKVDNVLAAHDILQARLDAASMAVVSAEQAFYAYIADNIDTITRETGRTDIGEMRRELDRLIISRDRGAGIAEILRQNISLGDWLAASQNLQLQTLSDLQRHRDELVTALAAATSTSQSAIDIEAQLTSVDINLSGTAQAGLSALRQAVSADQARASQLRQQIRTLVVSSNLPAVILAQIFHLQQSGDIARTQYQTLLSRIRELDAQAQTQIADARIVSQALPPATPSFPNTSLIMAMAGALGVGLGISLALLYENFLGGFVSISQIENGLRTRVAASIPFVSMPHIQGFEGSDISVSELIVSSPLSGYAEAVRRLRAALDNALRRHKSDDSNPPLGKVIMLSSAMPAEGKSTLALSLGRSCALSGRSAVLIDCDLRNPSLHHLLDEKPVTGLGEYLTHSEDLNLLREITTIDKQTPLSVILGTRRTDTATDHISATAAHERLIRSAKGNFDYVILDTPPIIPVVDGLYLAEQADAIAMVVRWSATKQTEARQALRSLQEVKRDDAEIVVVMNQQEGSATGYHYRYEDK